MKRTDLVTMTLSAEQSIQTSLNTPPQTTNYNIWHEIENYKHIYRLFFHFYLSVTVIKHSPLEAVDLESIILTRSHL